MGTQALSHDALQCSLASRRTSVRQAGNQAPRWAAPCLAKRVGNPPPVPILHGTSSASRHCKQQRRHAAAAPASTEDGSGIKPANLADLELETILDKQGLIMPISPEDSKACVYAIFDDSKRLQYIGFGRELRNSLRTLFARRPDKAYFYKVQFLSVLDQAAMVAIRDSWFEQVGGPPTGNKLALERATWQQPYVAFTISDRGKRAAAEEALREALNAMRLKGCKETFEADPALLDEGKVEFLQARTMTEEEMADVRAAALAARAKQRLVTTTIAGEPSEFEIYFRNAYQTNGGWMYDVNVTHANRETSHRIIVGDEYYEPYGMDPQDTVVAAFEFILQHDMVRQTEGMLRGGQFPVNYFSCSELEQTNAEFVRQLAASVGMKPATDESGFWRFNKMHDYGGLNNEDVQGWSDALDNRNDNEGFLV